MKAAGVLRRAVSRWTTVSSLKFFVAAAALLISFYIWGPSQLAGPQRLGCGNAGPGSWPFVEGHMLRLQDVLERAVGGDKGHIIGNIAFHPLQVRHQGGESAG